MRKVINCAVTLALLVIGAAAQIDLKLILAGEDIIVPEKGVIRAQVADLSVDIPVS
jgi:hypothetical protein